jgi:hypothetical protein
MQCGSLKASLGTSLPCKASRARVSTRSRVTRVTQAVADLQKAVPFLPTADHLAKWSNTSWRNFTALQQPEYPDQVSARAWGTGLGFLWLAHAHGAAAAKRGAVL